jgi:hypothetical protein
MTIVSVGRRRMGLRSSSVFADPTLHVDCRGYLSAKRSFHVSFYGRANVCEILNVNAKIRTMSPSGNQMKRNLSLIPSLNQSQSRIPNQTMRMR